MMKFEIHPSLNADGIHFLMEGVLAGMSPQEILDTIHNNTQVHADAYVGYPDVQSDVYARQAILLGKLSSVATFEPAHTSESRAA